DAELDFLDGDDLLVLLCRALLLFFLIQELAVILNTADRRICRGGDLYQVKTTLAGNFEGFKGLHHTKLSAVLVYDTDFAGANTVIGANSTAAKTFIDTFLREIAREPRTSAEYSMGRNRVRSHRAIGSSNLGKAFQVSSFGFRLSQSL